MKLERQLGSRQFLMKLLIFGLLISSLSLSSTSSSLVANDNAAIRKLKEIQTKVSNVVTVHSKATVAIYDGVGFGSGVIVSEDGLVLTAGHVMAAPDQGQYEITLSNGKVVKAKTLGKNLDLDCGMCQIVEPGPFPFVELDKTNILKKGEWLVSLGHSGGWQLGRTAPVRTGRVIDRKSHQVLTDAVLIGGDSGGPLFNLDGKLVAIHSSIGDSVAENRHVTIDFFLRDWDRLKSGESWGRLPDLNDPSEKKRAGVIGVKLDLSQPHAVVRVVNDGSSAKEIGLKVGDVITQFDDVLIIDGRHLIDVIKRKFAGDVCPIVIMRDGREIRFEIMLRQKNE